MDASGRREQVDTLGRARGGGRVVLGTDEELVSEDLVDDDQVDDDHVEDNDRADGDLVDDTDYVGDDWVDDVRSTLTTWSTRTNDDQL